MRFVASIVIVLTAVLAFFWPSDKGNVVSDEIVVEQAQTGQTIAITDTSVAAENNDGKIAYAIKSDPDALSLAANKNLESSASRFTEDLKAWPLEKCPDFWILKSHVSEKDWNAARQLLKGLDHRPLPWHLRKCFNYFLARIEFLFWLNSPASAQFEKFEESLNGVIDQIPESWTKENYYPGIGFIDLSVATATEEISVVSLIASASAIIEQIVQNPDKIGSFIYENDDDMADYCMLRLGAMNSAIPPLEINQRYAAVDFIVQSRVQFLPPGHPVMRHSGKEWSENVETYWKLPSIPTCGGRLFQFFRHAWYCSKHHRNASDSKYYKHDFILEAWNVFLFANPDVLQYLERH